MPAVQRAEVGHRGRPVRVGHVVVEVAAPGRGLAAGAAAVPVDGADLLGHRGGGPVPVGAQLQRAPGEVVDGEPAPD